MSVKRQPRQPLPKVREKKETRQKPWKWFAAVLIAISSFSLASQFICFHIPRTVSTLDIPALNPKLEDIKRESNKYDFVFLGSSRVFRGINPIEIEAEARKQACNIKTYNFGIGGLSILEQRYILNRLYESGIDIDTIIIEPYSVSDTKLDGFISDRRRYFYTWDNLPDLLLDQVTMPNNILYKARSITYLLFGFIREQTGVGRLSSLLFPQQPKSKTMWSKPIRQGYMPLDEELGHKYDIRRQQLVRRTSKFEKTIERYVDNPSLSNSSGNRLELVRDITNNIRRRNIKPAIIFMPSPSYIAHSRDLEDKLSGDRTETLTIMNMNNPSYYIDLFEIENYFDGGHLNHRGATILAKHLAHELCAMRSDN